LVQSYFKHFSTKKLARLAQMGLFKQRHGWQNNYVWTESNWNGNTHVQQRKAFLKTLDRAKLMEVIRLMLDNDKYGKDTIEALFEQLKAEKIRIGDDIIKAYLSAPNVDKKKIINDSLSDAMKDFVADHFSYYMDSIATPTPHMVEKLFDEYGSIDDKGRLDYHFWSTVKRWFGYNDYWFRKSDANKVSNPQTVSLLKAEAVKRKGVALAMVLAVFRHIEALKKKVSEKGITEYESFDAPKVQFVNKSWLPKGKKKKFEPEPEPEPEANDEVEGDENAETDDEDENEFV